MNKYDLSHGIDDDSQDDTAASQFRLRSYQAEMVEESIGANIIVVMDTGSGKTHIAMERTRIELETCPPNQLVWFLGPTVTLCKQQYEVFKTNLPNYVIQILSGEDDIDRWTDQNIWDTVLKNVRIVFSTHQVLLDALSHAFVSIEKIALLIFDEAHHCALNHPARRIMKDFYKPWIGRTDLRLPRVLGLTASPIKRAKATAADLSQIEWDLHSITKTPRFNRTELAKFVHKPEMLRVEYAPTPFDPDFSDVLSALRAAVQSYDIRSDPYVLNLLQRQQNGEHVGLRLKKTLLNEKTYCLEQLKKLLTKSENMAEELGISAMGWYIRQCIAKFMPMTDDTPNWLLDDTFAEKQHLLGILSRLPIDKDCIKQPISLAHISHKVNALINLLAKEASKNAAFTGLVFVEQRVWVATLAEILHNHPQTRNLLRVGTYIGTSHSNKRTTVIAALAEAMNQQTTLDDFRAGSINLILATTVLEEGIDVSSCHLVICFESPKDLKSYLQRRGRARKEKSKYFIFTPSSQFGCNDQIWEQMEAQMITAYLDDKRQAEVADMKERECEQGERYFRVERTGALLTLENASQHLQHFCALLGSGPYVDTRPQYDFTHHSRDQITAQVILPISVDPSVRMAKSLDSWRTERMARKDVAFEAYKKLYAAGLINDNLLPARDEEDEMLQYQIPDHRPAMVEVAPTFDPWSRTARCQLQGFRAYEQILLQATSFEPCDISMLLLIQVPFPFLPPFQLYWNASTTYTVKASQLPQKELSDEEMHVLQRFTRAVLESVHTRLHDQRNDFLWLLAPYDSHASSIDFESAVKILKCDSQTEATDLLADADSNQLPWGIVTLKSDSRKYICENISKEFFAAASSNLGSVLLPLVKLPRRRDFLHPVAITTTTKSAYAKTEMIPASDCLIGNIPSSFSIFALLLPCVIHKIETYVLADTLRLSILEPVGFNYRNLPVLVKALTSSATGEIENYQRLEFLGDCILKFITTVHLMAEKPRWPESLLTARKGKIVSNGFLARATLSAGLDQFVITKRFTGAKWAPRYAGEVLDSIANPVKVQMSSKLIADIIESLIGASYVTGGMPKANLCVRTLLPSEDWISVLDANSILFDAASSESHFNSCDPLEQLIGHTFHNKMTLIEALTHASYSGANAHCSYERLEFLGDAVLDYIVSTRLHDHEPSLSHQKMHGIRTAMVNASFLTYRMFETTVDEEFTNKATLAPEIQQRALWQYLRTSDSSLIAARNLARQQHMATRDHIATAFACDARYPWHLFARTDPPKFLSDVVESVIGAVYVDSRGDIGACKNVIRRLGILDCLEYVLQAKLDCLHPKERLGHLAVEKSVTYANVETLTERAGARRSYVCQVKVGGEDVGGAVEGLRRLNAETIAAWNAVGILEMSMNVNEQSDSAGDEFFDANEGGGVLLDQV